MEERVILNRRKHIRFSPEILDIAFISGAFMDGSQIDKQTEFESRNVGLILEESYSGCSLLFKEGHYLHRRPEVEDDQAREDSYTKGQYYLIQVGRLAPLKCIARWRKEIEPGLVKVGFEFME